jgi:hypothetical protein
MKPNKPRVLPPLSHMATVLLDELRDECETAIALIDRLKKRASLTRGQQDDVLGELSASIIHLHIHTDGLDDIVIEAADSAVSEQRNKPKPRARVRRGGVRAIGPRRIATAR